MVLLPPLCGPRAAGKTGNVELWGSGTDQAERTGERVQDHAGKPAKPGTLFTYERAGFAFTVSADRIEITRWVLRLWPRTERLWIEQVITARVQGADRLIITTADGRRRSVWLGQEATLARDAIISQGAPEPTVPAPLT